MAAQAGRRGQLDYRGLRCARLVQLTLATTLISTKLRTEQTRSFVFSGMRFNVSMIKLIALSSSGGDGWFS